MAEDAAKISDSADEEGNEKTEEAVDEELLEEKDGSTHEEDAQQAERGSSWIPTKLAFSPHLEMVSRTTAGIFLSYCLAYAKIPKAIPPSGSTFVGFVGVILSTTMPTYVWRVGGTVPVIVVAFLTGFGGATMLLATATAGTNAFVAVFCVWALWSQVLSYGPHANATSGLGRLVLTISTLLVMGSYGFVVNGLKGTEDIENLNNPVDSDDGAILSLLKTLYQNGTIQEGDSTEVEIQEGDFSGQFLYVELQDSSTLFFSLPGGMWWVKGFWKWRGMTNPYAVMRNALIGMLWGLFCANIVPLLPPWRTIRNFISRGLLPNAMRGTAQMLTASVQENNDDENKNDNDKMVAQLNGFDNALKGGKIAFPTAFEWRLLDIPWCGSPTNPHVKLAQLAASLDLTIKKALALEALPPYPEKSRVWLNQATEALEECASALQTGEKVTVTTVESDDSEDPGGDDLLRLRDTALQIRNTTNAYIDAVTEKGAKSETMKENAKKWWTAIKPLFLTTIMFLTAWFPTPSVWRRFWSFSKVLDCFEFALGFAGLLCMSVYWKEYRQYELNAEPEPDAPLSFITDPLQNFGAWNLITYVMSVMTTVEGSGKKALIRLLGVAFGGLNVWLALLATNENVYGMIAWLTITAFGATYLAVDRNPVKARNGRSSDFGNGPFFFILTNTIVALDANAGKGSRNELVENRVVASIIGVAAAFLISILPPVVRGGHPALAKQIVMKGKKTLAQTLRLVLDRDESELKELGKQWDTTSSDLMSEATYLLEDASLASKWRVFRVDPKLRATLQSFNVTSSFLHYMIDFCRTLCQDDNVMKAFAEGADGNLRSQLEYVIDELEDGKDSSGKKDPTKEQEDSMEEAVRENQWSDMPLHLLQDALILKNRLETHETVLASCKYKFWSTSADMAEEKT